MLKTWLDSPFDCFPNSQYLRTFHSFMAPKQRDCGQFLHDLVIVPELRQLFKAHSVTSRYAWDLASSQHGIGLSESTMHPFSHLALDN